ncbi:M15 family metallopeptidase [Cellulomonas sp. PhB143]|uniref:M15 family metallopeptidase n=1 Tax=Cellulomonas sp. PhB143 TaxID=2485186 RepID=UPI000F49C890|nr:M15 family metallopeptidase [Cellulomonas sp. PhB143]ROS78487.1 D-alanyl-D-alanine carboxypeptidase-like protein [Cellulomonas sp. PhB143]
MDQTGTAPLTTRRALREAEQAQARRRPGAPEPRRAAPRATQQASRTADRSRVATGSGGSRPRRPVAQPVANRWAPRAVVVSSLAVATIAIPLSGAADVGQVPFAEGVQGPSTLDVVLADDAGSATSPAVAAASGSRTADETSRSTERSALPGCDPDVRPTGTNGHLDESKLCTLWDGERELRPDAAVSLAAFNEAFRGMFGRDLCLVSSYRSISSQVRLSYTRAGYAARPGTSMHGWGLAVDMCHDETGDPEVYSWILDNIGTYGWDNPDWARGGYEPWHLEYTTGVAEIRG